MRRHQRYDAEQIVRDSGKAAGDEPLFGPVLNIKVFDYQLDIDGVQAITHTLATGPVNDLELALFPDEAGGLSLEVLANKQRYDEQTLRNHIARLSALLAQFADNPALRCGDANMLSAAEAEQLRRVNDTAVDLPLTTLSALVAEQAAKTPDAPALADAAGSLATARCASRWWRWLNSFARGASSRAIAWRWRCRVRYS
jgi:enterobactin synthetase component F